MKKKQKEELKKDVKEWLKGDQRPPPKKDINNIYASLGVKESDDKVAEDFIRRAIHCCSGKMEELKTLLPRLTRRELLIVFNYERELNLGESTKNEAVEELKRDVRKWLEEDQRPPPKKAAGNICASLGVKESDDEVAEDFIKRAIHCCNYKTEELKTLFPRLTGRELLIVFNYAFIREIIAAKTLYNQEILGA